MDTYEFSYTETMLFPVQKYNKIEDSEDFLTEKTFLIEFSLIKEWAQFMSL